jgi:Flp pilus assembly protein TadG
MKSTLDKQEKGVICVELAVILPFLTLLLLGALDLGLLIHEHQVLQNAAREGARYSAQHRMGVHSVTLATIQTRVVNYCAQQNITIQAGDVAVNQAYQHTHGGTTISGSQVTITRSRSMITPGMSQLLGDTVTLRGQGVFRNLY